MSKDRSEYRYKRPDGGHEHDGGFCAGCETFHVLRQVEGFHEEVAEIGDLADSEYGDGTPDGSSDRIVHAVEAAALRGFVLGIELATRHPIDDARLKEIEDECAGFLE